MVEENKNQETKPVEQIPAIEPAPQQQTAPEQTQPTQETPTEEKPTITQEERILSALAYMSVAFIIPLILKPDSKVCQFHARQGAGMFALCILVLIMLIAMPILGTLLFLGFFGLSVLAIYKAYIGDQWKIPVIGEFAGKVDLNKFITPTTPSASKKTEKVEKKDEQAK
ncbi:MAG: hypothetical protein ACD_51C00046G0004 [uncultured bacterium]|nr:MAG: hypothetical protein ACD_51C00046G0004 [uncultured bacterium]OGJ47288.1 MAG: hypothetical protein A2244_00385 [Candidatus Peregrinibacteria bacterium RIFOXYA2_FULL_41_18]OGJ48408.1 MAG: hypothetical protein A2344_05410 [Candidatus Peregrinibacteria bacterium RIFOXYB12_FULL_41_12]OGJ52563.1 MAG: hypothetical protein A2448_03425 [Candidatus Peregrinibacteria bacterium RIFOXYC2_FULL_41_22]OGJ53754.1 MAG: hypothetical protein A2336_01925 [Candidatus Peregrinibacteria bacterium RIFOXYB2_FULL